MPKISKYLSYSSTTLNLVSSTKAFKISYKLISTYSFNHDCSNSNHIKLSNDFCHIDSVINGIDPMPQLFSMVTAL